MSDVDSVPTFHNLLNILEAAEYLGVKPGTLRYWIKVGLSPDYLKIGERTRRFRRNDMDAWLESHKLSPTPKKWPRKPKP